MLAHPSDVRARAPREGAGGLRGAGDATRGRGARARRGLHGRERQRLRGALRLPTVRALLHGRAREFGRVRVCCALGACGRLGLAGGGRGARGLCRRGGACGRGGRGGGGRAHGKRLEFVVRLGRRRLGGRRGCGVRGRAGGLFCTCALILRERLHGDAADLVVTDGACRLCVGACTCDLGSGLALCGGGGDAGDDARHGRIHDRRRLRRVRVTKRRACGHARVVGDVHQVGHGRLERLARGRLNLGHAGVRG